MDTSTIRDLIQLMEASSLSHLEVQEGEWKAVLKRETGPVTAPIIAMQESTTNIDVLSSAAGTDDGLVTVKSPIVGVLYRAKEPGAPPFVSAGQAVRQGDVLCLVEAMKMFSEIKAPCDGIVKEILFDDGGLAEFNMPLFKLGAGSC